MKATKQKITFEDGFTEVHYTGIFQLDLALCGQDLAGDGEDFTGHGGYSCAEYTNEEVNCKDCLAIVKYCEGIIKK